MELTVRSTRTEDAQAWHALWRGYCAALDGAVSDKVTEGVWQRILASNEPVWCLLACRAGNEPVGFANYVLHPHTWSLQPVCYLEDLFVAPEARSSGAGRALIEGIVALGRRHGWRRVYCTRMKTTTALGRCMIGSPPRTDYVRYDIDL
jgi:GNAT superfamily N-acetyltransferase